MQTRISKGVRKYLRTEKNKIRHQLLSLEQEKKMIDEIYERLGLKKDQSPKEELKK
jgi:hypothetical protein